MKTARADISVDNSTVTPTTENQGQASFFFFFFKRQAVLERVRLLREVRSGEGTSEQVRETAAPSCGFSVPRSPHWGNKVVLAGFGGIGVK